MRTRDIACCILRTVYFTRDAFVITITYELIWLRWKRHRKVKPTAWSDSITLNISGSINNGPGNTHLNVLSYIISNLYNGAYKQIQSFLTPTHDSLPVQDISHCACEGHIIFMLEHCVLPHVRVRLWLSIGIMGHVTPPIAWGPVKVSWKSCGFCGGLMMILLHDNQPLQSMLHWLLVGQNTVAEWHVRAGEVAMLQMRVQG